MTTDDAVAIAEHGASVTRTAPSEPAPATTAARRPPQRRGAGGPVAHPDQRAAAGCFGSSSW